MKKYLIPFLACAILGIYTTAYGTIQLTRKIPGTFLEQYYYMYTEKGDKTTFIGNVLKKIKAKNRWMEIWSPNREKFAIGIDKNIIAMSGAYIPKRKVMAKFILKLKNVTSSYYPIFKGASSKTGPYWWENNKEKTGKNSPYAILFRGKKTLILHIHEVVNRHAYPLILVNNKTDKAFSVTYKTKNKTMLISPYFAIYIKKYDCTILESFYDTFSTGTFRYVLKDAIKRGFIKKLPQREAKKE